jgi:hypothetical protein
LSGIAALRLAMIMLPAGENQRLDEPKPQSFLYVILADEEAAAIFHLKSPLKG